MGISSWLVKRLTPAIWRIQMEARIELCEAQMGDLRERFTRFQSRDNMRMARDTLGADQHIADRAAEILAKLKTADDTGTINATDPAIKEKIALWKKRRLT